MPKVRRARLPDAVLEHLIQRADQRQVRAHQLRAMLIWLDTDPTVPDSKWFKRFPGFIVCGEGELVKTFLLPGQSVVGTEVI